MMRITKLKPVTKHLELLSHQFLQRCSVSGTAKGKAKIKAAQLKKTKISTKKGSADFAPKSAKGHMQDQRQKLYDEYLNAAKPVRHLSPNEKAREAEQEKLGLISKERQRELDNIKKGGR